MSSLYSIYNLYYPSFRNPLCGDDMIRYLICQTSRDRHQCVRVITFLNVESPPIRVLLQRTKAPSLACPFVSWPLPCPGWRRAKPAPSIPQSSRFDARHWAKIRGVVMELERNPILMKALLKDPTLFLQSTQCAPNNHRSSMHIFILGAQVDIMT